jgi:uncharacterized protein (DUF3084 family)
VIDIPANIFDYGVLVALTIITVGGIWKVIIPALLKQWEMIEKDRIERERVTAEYYKSEIQSYRTELKHVTAQSIEAFNNNTKALENINVVLSQLSARIETLSSDHHELKDSVKCILRENKVGA